jgi:hypothetical protein
MLNIHLSYCMEWGLYVNVGKRVVMVFNQSGGLLKESSSFLCGDLPIISAREHSHLRTVFNVKLNGALKTVQNSLRQKALRGYFSLKNMIDLSHLKKSISFELFDSEAAENCS